jgi:DNA-binding NtrC family response regulator
MADNPRRDWKTLAQLAAMEHDPDKLTEIIHELNFVLAERELQSRGKTQSKRLLLVDDDEKLRLTLLPFLQEHGFEAQIASTVPDALAAIDKQQFDILLCDLNLSEPSDGFGVVAAMRKAHPRSVIVLMTGYPAFETAVKGLRQQVDDYIVKPADYDTLIDTLDKKLAAKRGF